LDELFRFNNGSGKIIQEEGTARSIEDAVVTGK
jgi:hypothetical protein